jgi:saccharopine dehydrogenase-like NADP-dependent oxidoreductase
VVGLGTSPGLTNIIARYGAQRLGTVTSVHFAPCTGPWTRGAAVWAHWSHVNSGVATVYRMRHILPHAFAPSYLNSS